MLHALPFSAEALLESIEGVTYAVDQAGMILGFSRGPFLPLDDGDLTRPWDHTAAVGKCLFDLVQGPEVQASYRTLHRMVWSGSRYSVGFTYRCDAPAIERHMRMSLSLIAVDAQPIAVLYQSIIITETPRVPLPLFAADLLTSGARFASRGQVITLCSYCQRVAWPIGADETRRVWIEATEYYRRGGDPDVSVSHGVCKACFERVLGPPSRPNAWKDRHP